ncbi:MAG TPA: hypothetical protein VNH18_18400 [Bryobacteraceae bacterium]|nr:hypothetical protein [Bryobacteraceae bacterium]HXJ41259.1 hypothetical protein [Bryobacteraceae bacterium]
MRFCSAVFLSVLAAGCGDNAKQRASVLEGAGKSREALALDGVSRLRDAFNRGACQSIWQEADPLFRLREPQQEWMSKCDRMRQKLGALQSFQVHLRHGPDVPISIVVYGEGEFARGRSCAPTYLETVWHFDQGRTELFSLYLNGEAIPAPSWPLKPGERYQDPPPKRERKPG